MRLGRDVERRRRLVGEMSAGRWRRRGRAGRAGTSARELERIAAQQGGGSGSLTSSSSDAARRGVSRRLMPSRFKCSPNCWPMVSTGLSAESGSCGTKAMRSPSRARWRSAGKASRSVPPKASEPAVMRKPGGRFRPMIRPIIVLPAPDSPTSPSIRPAASAKLTSRSTGTAVAADVDAERQPAGLEQRHPAIRRWRRGSRPRRSPSPSRLAPSTLTKMPSTGRMRPIPPVHVLPLHRRS